MNAPSVRCSRCHRVRDAPGQEWRDHPAKLPHEVSGICALCADLQRLLSEQKWEREGRDLLRKRARGQAGFEPVGEVFRGFRAEGDKMAETVDAMVVAPKTGLAPLTMDNAPTIVLEEAQKAANALANVIALKPKKIVINGEQYLEFEDWQTVGRFYGVTAGVEGAPEYVEVAGAKGFKATAVALHDGQVVSRATAYCMDDEDRWAKAPTYQVASMAQTRANAKALRNVLSWVVVLAGYKTTPAEEMDGVKERAPAQQQGRSPARQTRSAMPVCPLCKKADSVMESKYAKPGTTHYCNPKAKVPGCGAQFEPASVTRARVSQPSPDSPPPDDGRPDPDYPDDPDYR